MSRYHTNRHIIDCPSQISCWIWLEWCTIALDCVTSAISWLNPSYGRLLFGYICSKKWKNKIKANICFRKMHQNRMSLMNIFDFDYFVAFRGDNKNMIRLICAIHCALNKSTYYVQNMARSRANSSQTIRWTNATNGENYIPSKD